LDSSFQIHLVGTLGIFDELHQHLGVGLGTERVAVLLQALLEHSVVLDDAIVDDSEFLRLGVVRVGIDGIGFAMGSPTCMGDTDRAAHIFITCKRLQISDFTFCFIYIEFARRADKCHTGTVITAVFEAMKPLDENRICIPFSDIAYNSTHK